MTDRNVFEALYFNQINVSPVIDLTDDIDESDDEIIYPDSFSSSVGKMLNEKSISAVLCNVEVFYKSQIEYLEDNRYDKQLSIIDNSFSVDVVAEESLTNETNEKIENKTSQQSTKHSFSSYYFIKQTFNCPTVLIDQLINTMSDMNIDKELVDDDDNDCPKHIEIDVAFDTDKSNIITKRDLRFLNYYEVSKPKKIRSNQTGKPTKQIKQIPDSETKTEIADIEKDDSKRPLFEIIEISDSSSDDDNNNNNDDEEENNLVNGNSSFNEIQELAGY